MWRIIVAVGLALVVVSSAAPVDVETAMKKGETLLANTEKSLAEYKKANKEHLVEMVQFEIALYKGFVQMLEIYSDLKRKNSSDPELALKYSPEHLQNIEDQMHYYEERIAEELGYAKKVLEGHDQPKGSIESLLGQARALIEKGEAILAVRNFGNTDGVERSVVSDLSYEVHFLKSWSERVQLKPTGIDLRKEIEVFERGQLSINGLLARMTN